MQPKHSGFMLTILKAFSMLVLILTLQATPIKAAEETLTIFWYTDASDVVHGEKPDVVFNTTNPWYGSVDAEFDNEREDAIKTMNGFRGNADPPAGDMQRLTWENEIDAQWQAQRCDSSMQTNLAIFVASKTRIAYKVAISIIVAEGKAAMKAGKCVKGKWHRHCMFYRNMMQGVSLTFECARSHCPHAAKPYRVYCDFRGSADDQSMVWGGMLYKPKTPCQLCPTDRGYCYNNLCVSGADKTKILKKNPSAIVTCDAPCMNCGVRKDAGGVCSCHCPTGYSEVDCSVGRAPLPATCGSCQRKGTPCLNGGRDGNELTQPCKCLCRSGFSGTHCELPTGVGAGGVIVPVEGEKVCVDSVRCGIPPFTPEDKDKIINDIKRKVADEVNKFCKKNQANYVKCCGASAGKLPNSGTLDFLDSSKVRVLKPIKHDKDGRLIPTVYTAVPGDNGLCRKTTAPIAATKPTPIVPLPPGVLREVIDSTLADKKIPCCDATVKKVSGDAKDSLGAVVTKKINCIEVHVG